MASFLLPAKRRRESAAMRQPAWHYDPSLVTQEASSTDDAAQVGHPTKKPRKSLAGTKVERVLRNFLKDHEWTPSWSSRFDRSSTTRRGPGAPGVVWTREQTIALIRLVVKTDLPIDHIHVALREQDGGFDPGNQACRAQWKKVFHSAPEQARLHCPEGQDKRYKDLKTAYEYHVKHERALARGSLLPAQSNKTLSQRESSGVHVSNVGQGRGIKMPTPPVSPENGEEQQTIRPKLDAEPLQLTPAATDSKSASPIYQSPSNGPQKGPPTTREECARRLNMEVYELEWIMYGGRRGPVGRVRDSWRSRHSRHYSVDSATAHKRQSIPDSEVPPVPTLFGTATQASSLIFQLLRDSYADSSTMNWDQLGTEVSKLITNKIISVHDTDQEGRTALHIATAMGCLPVVYALLSAGADPNALTKDGHSISAYSRKFARDFDLREEHIAHIETARQTVLYNPSLKNVERRVTVKRPTVDAEVQTDQTSGLRCLSTQLHSVPENEVPAAPAPFEPFVPVMGLPHVTQRVTTFPATSQPLAGDYSTRNSMYDGGGALQHPIPLAPGSIDGQQIPPSSPTRSIERGSRLLSMDAQLRNGAAGTSSDFGDVNILNPEIFGSFEPSPIGPRPPYDAPAASEPLQRYGLPFTASPSESLTTLVPDGLGYAVQLAAPQRHSLRRNMLAAYHRPSNHSVHSAVAAGPPSMPAGPFSATHANNWETIPAAQISWNDTPYETYSQDQQDPPSETLALHHYAHDSDVNHVAPRPGTFSNQQMCESQFQQQQQEQQLPSQLFSLHQPTQSILRPQPWTGQQTLRASQSVPAFFPSQADADFGRNPHPLQGFEFDFEKFHDTESYQFNLPHGNTYWERQ